MQTEILVHTGAGEPSRRTVDGVATLGGSQADGITVPGLSPSALRLEACAAGLVLIPAAPGLRLSGRPVAPGCRRLLMPGERATLGRVGLELAPVTSDGPTRVGAAALLREAVDGRALAPGPHLVVLTGGDAGLWVPLPRELVIGRGRGVGLRLRDPAASRHHARLRSGPAGATIEDLGAKNRLRLNGVAVDRRPVPLAPGDRITIGETELAYRARARGADPLLRATTRPAPRRPALPGARPLVAAGLLAASAAILAAVSSCGL